MKYPLAIFILITGLSQALAQSTIISLTVSPPDPTSSDNIEAHAELMFPSTGCQLDTKDHYIQGFDIMAFTHHCMGAATAICNATDTFELGQLNAGTYTFDLTLTAGFGSSGCTPGIVIDDSDQISFTVSGSVGINTVSRRPDMFYPNPTTGSLHFKQPLEHAASLSELSGKIVMTIPAHSRRINLSELPSGIYLLKDREKTSRVLKL